MWSIEVRGLDLMVGSGDGMTYRSGKSSKLLEGKSSDSDKSDDGMDDNMEEVADDLTELAGTVAGPPDTPYAGGKYKLEIKIPDTYPFNPPKVRMLKEISKITRICPR